MHLDDDGLECACDEQECEYREKVDADDDIIVVCPVCKSEDNNYLVHGDHGNRCSECSATFTCP